jgi:isopentenyl-diphosphate delta-isomerase
LSVPLLISSMTGGTEEAKGVNLALAEAAHAKGVAMGLGSQRAAIEDPSLEHTYKIRGVAPDTLLFANLGAVQLNYGFGIDHCRRAVDMIEADALILHFNALQEALQPEGEVNFSGLLTKIEAICRQLPVPVIAKEVGWGISPGSARKLVDAGVAAIDVAGAGGTSWSRVEMHRTADTSQARLADAFTQWGIPTAEAVSRVREALPEIPIIASGGIRDGIDIAKCIALGANLGGMAGPFLQAACQSSQAVLDAIEHVAKEIQITMFATGCSNLSALRRADLQVIS